MDEFVRDTRSQRALERPTGDQIDAPAKQVLKDPSRFM
jgi:hypothetical protein